MAVSKASAKWTGNLKDGAGSMKGGTGFFDAPFTFLSDDERWALGHVLSQAVIQKSRFLECRDRFGIEAIDLREHPPVLRSQQIAALAKEQVHTPSIIFQSRGSMLHAKRHFRRLGFDLEF